MSHMAENSSLLLQWGPVIDGVELSDEPQHLWEQHKFNPVDAVLLGSNTDEGRAFPRCVFATQVAKRRL